MDDDNRCPACRIGVLCWDSDADADDIGYDRAGIVSFYHCSTCGAEIEIFVPEENPYIQQ